MHHDPATIAAAATAVTVRHGKLRGEIRMMSQEEGEAAVADIILSNQEEYGRMQVGTLLRCVKWWGKTRVEKACALAGITSARRVGQLAELDRIKLASIIRGRMVIAHPKGGYTYGEKLARKYAVTA